MGPRGDAIVQMDWMTGAIVNEIEKLGLDENTLIIFTSDNGPILDDGYTDFAEEKLGNHKPGGPYRGAKYSAFEAGTRVPMITYWPSKIQPGKSDALICQIDYYASIANYLNIQLQSNEAIDSQNTFDAMLNSSSKARDILLEESFTLSLRDGAYKYISPIGDKVLPEWLKNKKIESGFENFPQLYDLSKDISEQNNLADQNKDLAKEMKKKLDSIVNINTGM